MLGEKKLIISLIELFCSNKILLYMEIKREKKVMSKNVLKLFQRVNFQKILYTYSIWYNVLSVILLYIYKLWNICDGFYIFIVEIGWVVFHRRILQFNINIWHQNFRNENCEMINFNCFLLLKKIIKNLIKISKNIGKYQGYVITGLI